MNVTKNPKILGIGNSIVDVIIDVSDDDIDALQLKKGSMELCDIAFQQKLLESYNHYVTVPGGSLANTMTTLGAMGIDCTFSSLVGHDDFGDIFRKSMANMNVETRYVYVTDNHTGKSIILVTPDGERTMNTHLGACEKYDIEYIENLNIEDYSHIFIEGYLLGKNQSFDAINQLVKNVEPLGTKIIITLSDSFCVSQNLERFKTICSHCSMIFANEKEFEALLGRSTEQEISNTLKVFGISPACEIVVTKSGDGCVFIKDKELISFKTEENQFPTDLTGAGDQFAGAYLFGFLNQWDITRRAKFANFLAGSIISQVGPRFSLNDLKIIVDNFK